MVLKFKSRSLLIFALLASIIILASLSNVVQNPSCHYDMAEFEKIAKAIEEGLKFFENHLDQALLDACMGSLGAQAQILLVLNSTRNIPQDVLSRLKLMEKLADSVTLKIIQSVKDNSLIPSKEKSETLPWVTNVSLWMQPGIDEWKSSDILMASETNNYTSEMETFHGWKSDSCIHELFSCETKNITQDCYEYMLSKPRYLYTLNHQVIYMLIAKQRKCGNSVHFRANFPNQDVDLFLNNLCSKVWFSARRVEQYNYFWGVRDLFTEQVALCSMAGYPNFLRKEWLHMILSWQSKTGTGCFLDPNTYSTKKPLYPRNTTESPGNQLEISGLDPTNLQRLRVKRNEAHIKTDRNEQCLLHFTAVGIIAISIHLRHLIETCYT